MKRKTILVLENNRELRLDLHGAFEDRGFRVASAETIEGARQLAAEFGADLDVLVLDMHLTSSKLTGADFGLEVREQQKYWPPEFVIHSGYDESEYYQLAARLRAATYLRKAEHELEDVVRQVRVLALRRSLSVGNPRIIEHMQKIARESENPSVAMDRFCGEFLSPKLEAALDVPFHLLISDKGGTRHFGSDLGLPRASGTYGWLQDLIMGRSTPLNLSKEKMSKLQGNGTVEHGILQKLEGTVFISLIEGDRIGLSIGVQQDLQGKFPENAEKLANTLVSYLIPAVFKHYVTITREWNQFHADRRAWLEATSRFCSRVGNEQTDIFNDIVEDEILNHPSILSIRKLSAELIRIGSSLSQIGRSTKSQNGIPKPQPLPMSKFVTDVWAKLAPQFEIRLPETLSIEGDCVVTGSRRDLSLAISRILRWMARRAIAEQSAQEIPLRIICRATARDSQIVFEDQNRRVPAKLRREIFTKPFAESISDIADSGLGLYSAKMLVELDNSGFLEDRSDEIEGDFGHRFVLRFPNSRGHQPEVG